MLGLLPNALRAEVAAFAKGVRESSAEDEAIESALRRQPVHPGYYWDEHTRRFELRGEYVDIPRRFLAFATRLERARLSFHANALGDVDDRATVLGFEDGDALRDWMLGRPEKLEPRAPAETLRSNLRRAGFTLPLDTVEGILAEALATLDGAVYDSTVGKQTEYQRRWRANRPEGVCQRCPLYQSRDAKPGRTLCEDCLAKLAEGVRRSRARRKANAA